MNEVEIPLERRPFQGVGQIIRFNWPFYLASFLLAVASIVLLTRLELPAGLSRLAIAALALLLFWTAGSLVVSAWVYDLSGLSSWRWIRRLLPAAPSRWANLHCGLDESTLALDELFPRSTGVVVDFYDGSVMTEASIRRARRLPAAREARRGVPSRLPLEDGAYDTLFLIFAAHEIRRRSDRECFFAELVRSLEPGGRVLLVEHLRDAPNFAAFGPGAFHFLAGSEWRRLARHAGLTLERDQSITPFVRVLLMRKGPV